MEVIGAYAKLQEFLHQLLHDFRVFIYSPEQNGLIAHRDSRINQASTGFRGLVGNLCWMIKMGIDVKRMMALQHVA
jgi:hypothetical protein